MMFEQIISGNFANKRISLTNLNTLLLLKYNKHHAINESVLTIRVGSATSCYNQLKFCLIQGCLLDKTNWHGHNPSKSGQKS